MPKQSKKPLFKQQLIDAGFIKRAHVFPYQLDFAAAADYLCVSDSTLKRWIRFESPCPRAVKMLEQHKFMLPKSWDGCTFYKDTLYTPFNSKGIDLVHIAFLSSHAATVRELRTQNDYNKRLVETLRGKHNAEVLKKRIECALHELNCAINEPLLLPAKG
jgi:hypothetical protein